MLLWKRPCFDSQEKENPVTVQFFETYSIDDIKTKWLDACKWSAEKDKRVNPGKAPLGDLGFKGLKAFIFSNYDNTIGFAKKEDVSAVDSILAIPEIAGLFPKDLHFLWSWNLQTSVLDGSKGYCLYAVKIPKNKKAPVDSHDVKESVPAENEETGMVNIHVELTKTGNRKLKKMTSKNLNRFIAVVLDGKVVAYPKVLEVITEKLKLDVNFTMEVAGTISDRMNAGR
ncbi:SecDF P1 head subdomain-containing protein [Fluviicola sp.]|uniref:SecDF P1 head subdomain-containing protein n=1 Tax=Fluviicola sp. TaxID=1917219 RepID=UPI003D2AA5AB